MLLIVAVLAVTGALTGYAPPTAATAASGPVNATQRIGPLDLQMTVDPARVGPNQVHLYLLNAKDGAPFTGTKELTVRRRACPAEASARSTSRSIAPAPATTSPTR